MTASAEEGSAVIWELKSSSEVTGVTVHVSACALVVEGPFWAAGPASLLESGALEFMMSVVFYGLVGEKGECCGVRRVDT